MKLNIEGIAHVQMDAIEWFYHEENMYTSTL